MEQAVALEFVVVYSNSYLTKNSVTKPQTYRQENANTGIVLYALDVHWNNCIVLRNQRAFNLAKLFWKFQQLHHFQNVSFQMQSTDDAKKFELLHYQSCSWFPYFIGMQSNKNILKIQQKDMLGHTETSKKQFFQCICTPRDTFWRKHAYYLSLYCKSKVPSSIQTSAWLSTSFFKKISHCGKLPPALA